MERVTRPSGEIGLLLRGGFGKRKELERVGGQHGESGTRWREREGVLLCGALRHMRGEELFACRGVVHRYGQVDKVSDLLFGCAIDGPVEVRGGDGEEPPVVTSVRLLDEVAVRAGAFEERCSLSIEHAIPRGIRLDGRTTLYEEQISGEGLDLQWADGAEVSDPLALTLPCAFLEQPFRAMRRPRADRGGLEKSGAQRLNGHAPGTCDLECGVHAGEVVLLVDGDAGTDKRCDLGVLLLGVFFVKGSCEEKISRGRGAEE